MAKVDQVLKRIFAWAVLMIVVAGGVVAYAHFNMQYRQAQRELIYIKAREQVAQEKAQRQREYQKRLRERELRQQFNRGRVVDISRQGALPPGSGPKK